MDQLTKRGAIIKFPVEVAEDEWADQLEAVLEKGIKAKVVDSFIAFAVMDGGESGFHIGAINVENHRTAYVLLGALEAMKKRILDEIGGHNAH